LVFAFATQMEGQESIRLIRFLTSFIFLLEQAKPNQESKARRN